VRITAERQTSVTLSDFQPFVLRNALYNALLNDPALNDLGPVFSSGPPLFEVARLDWSALRDDAVADESTPQNAGRSGENGDARRSIPALPAGAQFDVVLASDIICCDDDARGVAAALARHLRRPAPGGGRGGGVAVLCLPPPEARYGIALLPGTWPAGTMSTWRRGTAALHLRWTQPTLPFLHTHPPHLSHADELAVAGFDITREVVDATYLSADGPGRAQGARGAAHGAAHDAAAADAAVAGGYESRLGFYFARWRA
jgi:hypothetical protein